MPTFNPSITIGQSQNDASVGRYSQQNATARTAVEANARADAGSDIKSATASPTLQQQQQAASKVLENPKDRALNSVFPILAAAGVGYGLGYGFGYPTYDSIIMAAIGGGSYLVGDLLSGTLNPSNPNQIVKMLVGAGIAGGGLFLMGQDPGTSILVGVATSGTGTAVDYLVTK